ncbi:MAG: hypothetical protein Q8878_10550, partial [Bacillota bacterium]|nr:hypothetical protein [Bacillota bacterium]
GKSEIPGSAELRLDIGSNDSTPLKTEVQVNKSGTFSGKLKIDGLASGQYRLTLSSGETDYCTSYISVGEYIKPAFTIDAGFDKIAYFGWEHLNMTAAASFFDGTPASNIPFSIDSSNGTSEQTSDKNGAISKRFTYKDTENTWYPQSFYCSVGTAGAEDTMSQTETFVNVFPRDTMLNAKLSENSGSFSIEAETNRIDLSKISSAQDISDNDYSKIKGAVADIPVTLKIMEVTWKKNKTGSYYDYINKVVVPKYEYEKSEKQIKVYKSSTTGGKTTFENLAYKNYVDRYYYGILECSDSRGGKIGQTIYFCGDSYPNDSSIKNYYFSADGKNSLSSGESTNIRLMENSRPVQGKGRVLYAAVRSGIMDSKTVNSTGFSYTFGKNDIPNVMFAGAYFDGKNIYPVSSETLYYNPEEMRLTVEASADSDKYSPGQSVKFGILVKDKNNKPVPNASVCVSVVDEAAFAVANQIADPLGNIYSKYFYPIINTYASYVQHDFSGSGLAEKGGEGGSDYIRKNFLDTASFLTGTTGEDGRCSLTFA